MKYSKFALTVLFIATFAFGLSAQEITSFQGSWGDEYYQDKKKLSWKEIDAIMT